MTKWTNNIKSKTFKNHKLALYFRINIKGNKIEYFQVAKDIGYTKVSFFDMKSLKSPNKSL